MINQAAPNLSRNAAANSTPAILPRPGRRIGTKGMRLSSANAPPARAGAPPDPFPPHTSIILIAQSPKSPTPRRRTERSPSVSATRGAFIIPTANPNQGSTRNQTQNENCWW
jgi:hypothetical protein